MNHFAKVCKSANAHSLEDYDDAYASELYPQESNDAEMSQIEDFISDSDAESLVAHIQFEANNTFTDRQDARDIEEIRVKVTPFVPVPDLRLPNNIPSDNIYNF